MHVRIHAYIYTHTHTHAHTHTHRLCVLVYYYCYYYFDLPMSIGQTPILFSCHTYARAGAVCRWCQNVRSMVHLSFLRDL